MATYTELLSAADNTNLLGKVRVACVIAAEAIRTEAGATANHANRLLWAKSVFSNPELTARQMLWAVLGQNAGTALSQIIGASDATVQTAVNTAVDVFANGV
jgi:hypothetical protein